AAGLCAGAAADPARHGQLDRHLHVGARERVLERELHVDLDVRAAHGLAPRTRTAGASTTAAAEDPAEEVAEIADVEVAEVEVDVLAARTADASVRRAEAVVRLALLVVREHVVGGLHFLELLLRSCIARISVRVVLARELAVRLLDLVRGGALRDAERVVERLSHRSPAARAQ